MFKKKKKRQEINVGEDMEISEPVYTGGRNVKWFSYYGKQYEGSSKNKNGTII